MKFENKIGYVIVVDNHGDYDVKQFEKIRELKNGVFEIGIPLNEISHKILQVHSSKIFNNKKDALLKLKEIFKNHLDYYISFYENRISEVEEKLTMK